MPVPDYIRTAAQRGLDLRADGFGGDGLTEKTIREAREMADGRVSHDKAVRAAAWGARHAVDLEAAKNNDPDDPGWPGPGAVAHLLWGIDPLDPMPARRWFEREAGTDPEEGRVSVFGRVREARTVQGVEIRRDDGGGLMFRGYASVTGTPYRVGGDDGWDETITRGAFRRTLGINDNRALLAGHDHSRVLATTRSGALTMTEDAVGLLVEARLDTRVSWIADLAAQIETGTVDEMSIGFFARAQEWDRQFRERSITEVELVEASIVWAGANPATVASIERMCAVVAEARSATTSAVSERSARVAVAAQAAAAALSLR
jgi:HK97 family phage prohead protease